MECYTPCRVWWWQPFLSVLWDRWARNSADSAWLNSWLGPYRATVNVGKSGPEMTWVVNKYKQYKFMQSKILRRSSNCTFWQGSQRPRNVLRMNNEALQRPREYMVLVWTEPSGTCRSAKEKGPVSRHGLKLATSCCKSNSFEGRFEAAFSKPRTVCLQKLLFFLSSRIEIHWNAKYSSRDC